MDSLYPSQPERSPELVVGLISPIGSNLKLVIDVLSEVLSEFNYHSEPIRVSSLLHQLKRYQGLAQQNSSEYKRIKLHMRAGTEFRTKTEQGDVMALLATSRIRQLRGDLNRDDGTTESPEKRPRDRTAYILRSLKHPDEIETLRDIYGDAFVAISAYAPRTERVEFLAEVLTKSDQAFNSDKYRAQAEELISIDEEEEGNKLGQDVSDAFPLSDLFVDARSRTALHQNISRFFDAYFAYPFSSPTKDEYAMFFAKATALRSTDLARQVGAVLTSKDGDIISVGCNEAPKQGGGLYWIDDTNDARDFQLGYDTSAKYKSEMVAELLSKLKAGKWLSRNYSRKEIAELVAEATDKSKDILANTQMMNVIEYGRSVHAEMAAITDAAKRGLSVKGATLYCTTYPCHICARHIVSSGIERVVYVEPYPKSQTGKLYADSISTDPSVEVKNKVVFEPFVGISPRKYIGLFTIKGKRKETSGDVVAWERASATPNIKRFVLGYLLAEDKLIAERLAHTLENNRTLLDKPFSTNMPGD